MINNYFYEMLIRRSRSTVPVAIPTDYVFYAPLTQSLADESSINRTCTVTADGWGDETSQVTTTTYGGMACTYIPTYAKLLYTPNGGVNTGDTAKTMSIWVNSPIETGGWNMALAVGDNEPYQLFSLGWDMGGILGYGGYFNDIYSSTYLTRNAWNHIAVTYDTTAIKLYWNGELVHTSEQSGAVQTTSTAIAIGGRPTSDGCEAMYCHSARIYNRALTAAEILQLAQEFDERSESQSISESESVVSDLVFYMPFTDSLTADVAGGRTMQVTGSPTLTTVDGIPCASVGAGSKLFSDVVGNCPTGDSAWTVCCYARISDPNTANNLYAVGTASSRECILQGAKYGYPIYNNYYPDQEPYQPAWPADTWVHTAATYDPATHTIKGYFNGQPNGSWDLTSYNGLNITFGGIHLGEFGGYEASASYIASPRIYNRVLSDSEIDNLYHEYIDDEPSESVSQSISESESVLPVVVPSDYTKAYPLSANLKDSVRPSDSNYDLVKGTGVSVSYMTSYGIQCATVTNGCLYNLNATGARTNGCALSLWQRCTATPTNSSLPKVFVNASNTTTNKYAFWIGYKNSKYAAGTKSAADIVTTVDVNTKWHHLLLNYDQTNLTIDLWIDGVKQGTATLANALVGHTGTVVNAILAAKTNPDGLNDTTTRYADIKYFNRTLSDSEIRGLAGEH